MSKNKYTLAQLAAIYTTYKDLDIGTRTVNCCTCGRSIHIENIEDCYNIYGHFIPRSVEPKLKYHPKNTHAQCISCNMQVSKQIDFAYDRYMKFRYGEKIISELKADDSFANLEYAKQWYVFELIKLSQKFPELSNIVVDETTGELLDVVDIEDPIQEQWDTYSPTYKQDLDELTKLLGTEPIEYERL